MARIFTWDCECGFQTAERVEYSPPAGAEQVGENRYKIDLSVAPEHDGYPDKDINCPECGRTVHSKKLQLWEAPPLYFNYMSHEDDD